MSIPMDAKAQLFSFLNQLAIPYRLLEHAPVRDMQDCAKIAEPLGAIYPKNLFLTPRSKNVYCLLLTQPFARYNASVVSAQAGLSRLQFADDAAALARLCARSGAITPLALCLPQAQDVRLLVDSELAAAPFLCFHPLDPGQTVVLAGPDFFARFLPATGHAPNFVTL